MVSVGPPLSWRPAGSNRGSATVPGQVDPGYCRLLPPSMISPEQFPPETLFATIVF
jgi:hypothetical protein